LITVPINMEELRTLVEATELATTTARLIHN